MSVFKCFPSIWKRKLGVFKFPRFDQSSFLKSSVFVTDYCGLTVEMKVLQRSVDGACRKQQPQWATPSQRFTEKSNGCTSAGSVNLCIFYNRSLKNKMTAFSVGRRTSATSWTAIFRICIWNWRLSLYIYPRRGVRAIDILDKSKTIDKIVGNVIKIQFYKASSLASPSLL